MCICLSKGDARTRKLRGSESMNRVCLRTVSRLYSPEPKQLREQQRGRKDRVSKAGLAALNKELYGHIYSCRKTLRRLLTFAHGRWLLMYPPHLLSLLHSFFLFRFIFSATASSFCPFFSFTTVSFRPSISPAFLSLVDLFVLFHSLSFSSSHTHTHTYMYEQLFLLLYLPLSRSLTFSPARSLLRHFILHSLRLLREHLVFFYLSV